MAIRQRIELDAGCTMNGSMIGFDRMALLCRNRIFDWCGNNTTLLSNSAWIVKGKFSWSVHQCGLS